MLHFLFLFFSMGLAQKLQPNFIVMNMDDLGWGDLGCMGNPAKETPHLDKMAAEGIVFTDFYTSAAICSPSRASLFSGRLPIRNGFYQNTYPGRNAYTPQDILGGIPDSEILIPELLTGYKGKLIGKWHLGHQPQYLPLRHGFQEWFGAPNCHFKSQVKWRPGPNIPVYKDHNMIGRYYEDIEIDINRGVSNYTRILMDVALEYVARDDSNSPYLLVWAPDSTHAPSYSGPGWVGSSERDSYYGDSVRELDSAIGNILDSIRNTKSTRDTLVIFTSDNGAALVSRQKAGSNGPLLCGKQTTFEGGMRVPTIAWWSGGDKSSVGVVRQAVTQMDILPSLAELAGVTLPSSLVLDGQSIASTLLDPNIFPVSRPVFYYRGNMLFAVRLDMYKAHFVTWTTPMSELERGINFCPGVDIVNVTTTDIRNHGDNPVVFHIRRDPGEKYPLLTGSKEYKAAVALLKKVVRKHKRNLVPGPPQLEWCDPAVMNWAPQGCGTIGKCLPIPASNKTKCFWEH